MQHAAVQHDLVRRLREDLAERRIESGFQSLESSRRLFDSISPSCPGTTVLLGYIAQWVDVGFSDVGLVDGLLGRYPAESRIHLSLIEYLHLRSTQGLVAMWHEDFDCALSHFRFVCSVEEELRDNELIAISNFWIARCLRSTGLYDDALSYTIKARDIAFALGYPKMAAIMQTTESWLMFQKGRLAEASRILESAAESLFNTDDYVARGNIESAYGRIARRQSRYDRALTHFERAIEEYKKRDPQHRNLARSLVNVAFVKRLIGVRLQKQLDAELAQRKAGKSQRTALTAGVSQERARLDSLRAEAHTELNQAGAIYSRSDNHRGSGTVHINRGLLYVDAAELDAAYAEAEEAFRLGQEKSDYILMGRGRILQCIIEGTKFEEQIEDKADPRSHAEAALGFAREALEFAHHTQNRRLLARAQIWLGITYANGFHDNMEAARECCDAATNLLKSETQDYIWDDLQQLRAQILRKGRVDTILREWSQGLVADKSFQQITEEFATIVIPRVWEREERKVSRVAEKLSISPKKVRRILQTAGLLDRRDAEEGD